MTSGGDVPSRVRCVSRRPHHARAPRRVHVDHPHAQRRCGLDGRRDGVGDVVELQIEEDAFAQRDDSPDDLWPLGGEEPAANLEATRHSAECRGQMEGFRAGRHIQRNQELIHAFSFFVVSRLPVMSDSLARLWRRK